MSLHAQSHETEATALLARNCLGCHNQTARMGGLVLERRDLALQGGASGPALIPGDSARSILLQKVAAGKMPPGNPLPAAARQTLAAWINAGAAWSQPLTPPERKRAGKDWWSLRPLTNAQPPQVSGPPGWDSPIDRFLLAAMQAKKLAPSPPADRRTLIRRATFDLTGLPPTPEQVEEFAGDDTPGAYERLIDRLLASPAYGERWGRHWMDVIRFGESHGYEQNHLRPTAYHFRDYVIRSLNNDTPFDRMILEHLAGDVIANGDPEVEAGTGFLVAGPHDTVGNQNEAARRQQRADDLDDMVNATASAFLGLTVNCARCHDHKFDPIEQKDYYRMAAMLNGVVHGERPFATGAEKQRIRAIREPIERDLAEASAELDRIRKSAGPAIAARRGSILAGYRPAVDARLTEERFAPVSAQWLRLRVLRGNQGLAALEEIEVWSGGSNVALASAGATVEASSTRVADGNASAYTEAHLNDGKFDQRWFAASAGPVDVTIRLPRALVIDRASWSRDRQGGFQGRFAQQAIGAYAVEVSLDGNNWMQVASSDGRLPAREEDVDELLLLAVLDDAGRAAYTRGKSRRASLQKALNDAPKMPMAYLGRGEQPKEPVYLLKRGNVMDRAGAILPESLSTLGFASFTVDESRPESERRVALAKWLGDPANPLTPRVLVNRLWHYHFGRGIAGTPSDLGYNGERPTHPGLLDYLAGRLIAGGWRLKPIHREIMLSAAYRQSGAFDAARSAIDGDARYLWRFPSRRLEAEAVRDSVLAVSGKLDRRAGGPGFHLFRYTVDNVATYFPIEEFGPDTYRRAVYQTSARSVRSELLGQYDCPDSSLPEPRRIVTTSPLQALALLNNAFAVEQAKFFAGRLSKEAGADPAAQVDRAFALAYGRRPDATEKPMALELIARHGLAAFCRAILNSNEFLYLM